MKFNQELIPATLIKRYKRFLADVELPDAKQITVHCPNSGSMLGCSTPGSNVMLSRSDNPKRKYAHTLEMVQEGGVWIGVNTSRTNHLVREALENGVVKEVGIPQFIKAEIKTSPKSRLDFLIEQNGQKTYIEAKNCSLAENRIAMFPDAVTVRGTKHLHELLSLHTAGNKAAVLFCIQRQDADSFSPASHIDPIYSETLKSVYKQGVKVLAYQASVKRDGITIIKKLPVSL